MQTFLPEPCFFRSAEVLDRQRLNAMRREPYQIMRAALGITKGWRNHPATVMWREYLPALGAYAAVMATAWRRLGYEDSLLPKIMDLVHDELGRLPSVHGAVHSITERHASARMDTQTACDYYGVELPWWWGGPIHLCHRRCLIARVPEHYRPLWNDPPLGDDEALYWPGQFPPEPAAIERGVSHG